MKPSMRRLVSGREPNTTVQKVYECLDNLERMSNSKTIYSNLTIKINKSQFSSCLANLRKSGKVRSFKINRKTYYVLNEWYSNGILQDKYK